MGNLPNTIRTGLTRRFKNKPAGAYNPGAHKTFPTADISLEALAAHITAGYAFTVACYKDGHRLNANFQSAQLLALDLDNGPAVDALAADPFIAAYAWLLYPTPSSTPDHPKSRAIFVLSEPVTSCARWKALQTALIRHCAHLQPDTQASDGARQFYGSDKPGARLIGNLLPLAVAGELTYDEAADELRRIEAAARRPPPRPVVGDQDERRAASYADAALERIYGELRQSPAGQHHADLFRLGIQAYRFTGWPGQSEAAITAALSAIVDSWPKGTEHRRTLQDARRTGLADPRPVALPHAGQDTPWTPARPHAATNGAAPRAAAHGNTPPHATGASPEMTREKGTIRALSEATGEPPPTWPEGVPNSVRSALLNTVGAAAARTFEIVHTGLRTGALASPFSAQELQAYADSISMPLALSNIARTITILAGAELFLMVEHGEKPHLQPLGIIRRGPKTQHYTAPPLPAFYHALISRLRIFEAQRAHTVRYDNEPDPAEEIPAILAAEAFYGLLEPNDAAATADYLRGRDADLLAANATQRQRAADTLDKRLHTWQRQLRHAHSTPLASAGIPIDSAENYRLAFLRAVKLEAGADAPTAARRIADLIAVSPRRATTITRRAGFDVTPNFVEQTTTAADYRQAETVRGARPVSLRVDLPAYSEEIPYAYAGQELQAIPADTRVTVRLQAMNTHADNGNPRPYEKHKPNRQSAEPPRQEEPMPTPNRQPAKPEAEPAQAAPAIAIAPPDMNCRGYLREWTLGQLRLRLKARGFDDNRASGRMTRRAVIDPETGEVLTPAQAVPRSDAIALINALAGFELIAQTADGPHVDTLAAADPLLAVAREFGADIRRVA